MHTNFFLLVAAGAVLGHAAAIPIQARKVSLTTRDDRGRDDDWDDRGRNGRDWRHGDWDDDWDDDWRVPAAPPIPPEDRNGKDDKFNVFHPA